ncbi:MAG TPA: molybdopterin-dependent oxidoreductase [Daejeonella sp.]|uniref:molybdopterin-dependent oxidoreductase n=1 Tax=Daejeonella sp. TaxID=2805397 RepID=UPI002ED93932
MKKSLLLALTFIIFSGIYSGLKAQSESITFINESGNSSSIDPMKLKSKTIKAIGHDLKTHEYSGPLLSDFLSYAGVILGEPAKKQTVSGYITIRARDNYKCVFALAELDPLFSSSSIIIAGKMDGKALSENNGPYQIIAPSDKKHGRWIRQVRSIELHTVK